MSVNQRPSEDGQVLILTLGFTVLICLLFSVVVDVSHLYMARRSLVAAADAASLAAAQGINAPAVYAGKATTTVPLSRTAANRRLTAYVKSAGLSSKFYRFRVDSMRTNGRWVNVTLSARVRLPIFNAITGRAGSLGIRASARARSVVN